MSTGGIFQLITNDGKQDRMLMATALLNKRLLEIERMRAKNPQIKDPTPTLVDIERTHILFVNAHFKPFAAIGYEYNKVAVQSGQARLNSEVQFSIPQFGDFFNDMVLHIRLSSVEATNSAYWEQTGAAPVAAIGAELLRYVNFLGQRLLKNVRFDVNGNPLDQYDSDVLNFHQKFFVTPNKVVGWNRNVGQEEAHYGTCEVHNQVGAAAALAGRAAGVREQKAFLNGPQTPKVIQPSVDMWVPLIFWFNKDPRLAIPSVSIPYGQRFITIELARADEILQHLGASSASDDPSGNPVPTPDVEVCELFINNIFVNPEIHDIFIKRIGFSLIRVHRRQTIRTSKAQDSLLLNQLKWPVETIYAGLRPVANIDTTSTKMLDSWNIYAKTTDVFIDGCAANCTLLHPVTVAAGATPTAAELSAFTGLQNFYLINAAASVPLIVYPANTAAAINGTLIANGYPPLDISGTPTLAQLNAAVSAQESCCISQFQECTPTITRLTIEAHGVPLYRDIPAQFFNSYVPYTYGAQHINTPTDCGALMITFNLYPGSYQPSGHVNISRAREFYFNYVSDVVGDDEDVPNADLVIVAIAINFLLISDGSAVLRYST